ncbi:serine/threonine-protein kinase HipA [Marinomonas polaris DSM 16579]|uniref:Serine/threonine-protein kinase HipA n=1 Tax=Marinomonas polaris DSM 16579 TaxID=1122206 RepID=A0A1M5NU89_9GAMM|nr:serine/threonine-protein kinase HipA [Marinomonas polaris DSM 16579]
MTTEISVLKLTLHGHLVGYLAGAKNGRNILHFAESFQSNIARPTFSLRNIRTSKTIFS